MSEIIQILLNALPEALGGIATAAILAIVAVLYRHFRKQDKEEVDDEAQEPLPASLGEELGEGVSATRGCDHNLPAREYFLNREEEISTVMQALQQRQNVALEGLDGFGKTALALEVGHLLASSSPESHSSAADPFLFDAVIWLASGSRPLDPNSIIDEVSRVLGYPYIATLQPEDAIYELHKILRNKKALIIVDDFENTRTDDVWQLFLRLPEPTRFMITTARLHLEKVKVVFLDGLGQGESFRLLESEAQRIGAESILRADKKDLKRVYELASGNPLLLKWTVGFAKRTGSQVQDLIAKLERAEGAAIQRVWGSLWDTIGDDAKQVLLVVPLFTAGVTKTGISHSCSLSADKLEQAITELVDTHLLKAGPTAQLGTVRYTAHSVTRSFAQSLLRQDPGFEQDVRLRWVEYHLTFAAIQHGVGRTPSGYQAIALEHENLLSCASWCVSQASQNYDETILQAAIKFSTTLGDYLWAQGYWDERLHLSTAAISAAKKLENWGEVGRQAYSAAWVTYWRRRDHERIDQLLRECEAAAELSKDQEVLGLLYHMKGVIAVGDRRFDEAEPLLLESLALVKKEVGMASRASVMLDLGHLKRFQSQLEEARSWLERAFAAYNEGVDDEGAAIAQSYLAMVLFELGDIRAAKTAFETALDVAQDLGRLTTEARCKAGLAEIALRNGETALAKELLGDVTTSYERIGMSSKAAKYRRLLQQQ